MLVATLQEKPENSKEKQSDMSCLWLVEPQMCCCSWDFFFSPKVSPAALSEGNTVHIRYKRAKGGGLNRGITS